MICCVRTLRNNALGIDILVRCGPFRSEALAQGCSGMGQVQARGDARGKKVEEPFLAPL